MKSRKCKYIIHCSNGNYYCSLSWPISTNDSKQEVYFTKCYKHKVTAIKRAKEIADKLGLEIVERQEL